MREDFKKEWVAALRSGEYKQGYGELKNNTGEYCCLGVACDLLVKKGLAKEQTSNGLNVYALSNDNDLDWSVLPKSIANYLGLSKDPDIIVDGEAHCISGVNDEGKTFSEIATLIEEQL